MNDLIISPLTAGFYLQLTAVPTQHSGLIEGHSWSLKTAELVQFSSHRNVTPFLLMGKKTSKSSQKKFMENSQRRTASVHARRSVLAQNNKKSSAKKIKKIWQEWPGQEDFCFTFVTQQGRGGPRPSPPPGSSLQRVQPIAAWLSLGRSWSGAGKGSAGVRNLRAVGLFVFWALRNSSRWESTEVFACEVLKLICVSCFH